MIIIKPYYKIIRGPDVSFLKDIELAGRLCYKSEDKITENSYLTFVKSLITRGHEAMLEHAPNISVKFTGSRGFSHEIVRMRLASFAETSTRYINFCKEKHGKEITICIPDYIENLSEEAINVFMDSWENSQKAYMDLINLGVKPEIARDVLPIGIKTEIIITSNVRHWRHMFKLRIDKSAHPIMHELMRPLLEDFKKSVPILFDDIIY